MTTRKKLTSVSIIVTPVCKKILPSFTMLKKQSMMRDGELKIKSLMISNLAQISQSASKIKRSRMRQIVTILRRRFCLAINACWARVSCNSMRHLLIRIKSRRLYGAEP